MFSFHTYVTELFFKLLCIFLFAPFRLTDKGYGKKFASKSIMKSKPVPRIPEHLTAAATNWWGSLTVFKYSPNQAHMLLDAEDERQGNAHVRELFP